MYYQFFSLESPPFRITPDTNLFYSGAKRGAVLDALVYAVLNGEGIIKIVGEVGSGKTMLCRMLETRLPRHVETVYIGNPSLSPDTILQVIGYELKIISDPHCSKIETMQRLQEHLTKRHAEGRQVVVFVEEAQCMPQATLEEIRLLTNLETNTSKLLQLVLFGQPELDEKLAENSIRQLRERITHSFYLDPLTSEEIQEYLNFRMWLSGYRGPDIFSDAIATEIHAFSHGLVRRANLLADKTLLAAFADNTRTLQLAHVGMAAEDSQFSRLVTQEPSAKWRWFAILLLLCVGAASYFAWLSTTKPIGESRDMGLVQRSSIQEPTIPDVKLRSESEATIEEEPFEQVEEIPRSWPSYIDERIALTQETLKKLTSKRYSIQLLTVSGGSVTQLTEYLSDLPPEVSVDAIYIDELVTQSNAKQTVVLFGNFESAALAREALAELPEELQRWKPYVRALQVTKKERDLD